MGKCVASLGHMGCIWKGIWRALYFYQIEKGSFLRSLPAVIKEFIKEWWENGDDDT